MGTGIDIYLDTSFLRLICLLFDVSTTHYGGVLEVLASTV
jgi:hypothetical protein